MKPGCRFGIAPRLCGSSDLLAACLLLATFLFFFAGTASAAPQLQKEDVGPGNAEQALFVKGQSLYNQSLYHEAIAVFGDFLSGYPQSQIKDLVLLWQGRCHIRIGEVSVAEQIGARLREIHDTQLISLYEEELRAARRGDVKAPVAPARAESAAAANGSLSPYEPPKALSNIEPSVRIRMESPREITVGVATFYRLVVMNEGKGVARDLIVSELLPGDLQFASSDPAPSRQEPVGGSQRLTFRIDELKSGASRTLRIAVRLRTGARPEALLKRKHSGAYQDSDKRKYLVN